MSYTIFKSIKQNPDGSFSGYSAESNVFDYAGKHVFYKFNNLTIKDCDGWNNTEKRAWFILCSAYCGDKYYNAWSKDLKLAHEFIRKYDLDIKGINNRENIRAFAEFIAERKKARKNYNVIIGAQYVCKYSTRRVWRTLEKASAKIFRATREELEKRFSGYNTYGVEIVEA